MLALMSNVYGPSNSLPLLDTFLKWSSLPVNKLEKWPSSLSHHLGVELGLLSQLMWEIVQTGNLWLSAYRGEKYYINMVWVVRMKVLDLRPLPACSETSGRKVHYCRKTCIIYCTYKHSQSEISSFKSWTVIKGYN